MNTDIFVYCGAKCASSTLDTTFRTNGYKTFHVHNNVFFINNFRNIVDEFNCTTIKDLIVKQNKDKVYIFDIYRNPIERLISSLFQNLNLILGENFLNGDINLLIYYLFKNYKFEEYHPLDDEYPILRNIPFDDKYVKLIKGKFNYYKFRFKDLNKWSEYLSEIFEKEIEIVNENLSENKDYYDLLKKFKSQFKISRDMLDFFINTFTFNKYNSEEERTEYINEWSLKVEEDEYFERLIKNCQYINLPNDFDFDKYALLNPDVLYKYKTEDQLKFHYEFYGYKEKRAYKFVNLPSDFDATQYALLNPDVSSCYKTEIELKYHYEVYGWKENRDY